MAVLEEMAVVGIFFVIGWTVGGVKKRGQQVQILGTSDTGSDEPMLTTLPRAPGGSGGIR
jgi:hypothetical protein